MRKTYLSILSLVMAAGVFTACDDENDGPVIDPVTPIVEIVSEGGGFAVAQEDTLVLKARVSSPTAVSVSWTLNGEEVSTDTLYRFIGGELGKYTINATATNTDGKTTANAEIEVHGKYKHGTFVLSEGSMPRDEAGLLTFIDEKGRVTEDAYGKENGGELGKACQDIFIHNRKMYIVAQNGGNDGGFLTVLNAETLKQEKAYQEELSSLSLPTHVAVLGDDEIYLRDNSGIHVFHPSTGETATIEGTSRARKNTMAVAQGKVFAAVGKNVVVIEQGASAVSQTIAFTGTVSGVIKSSDGNLWVSTNDKKISKVDAATGDIMQTNDLGDIPSGVIYSNWAAAPNITAKGDTLYMSGVTTTIYRHIFSTGETTLMVDAKEYVEDCGIVYNTCAVHPLTGEVVLNSIKGYDPDYLTNHITFFDFSGDTPSVSADYAGYTRYPAGTFFTYNFE